MAAFHSSLFHWSVTVATDETPKGEAWWERVLSENKNESCVLPFIKTNPIDTIDTKYCASFGVHKSFSSGWMFEKCKKIKGGKKADPSGHGVQSEANNLSAGLVSPLESCNQPIFYTLCPFTEIQKPSIFKFIPNCPKFQIRNSSLAAESNRSIL